MAATDLERLVVQIEANTTKLAKDLAKLTSDMNSAANAVERRAEKMSSALTETFAHAGRHVASFFTVREIGRFVSEMTEAAHALETLSERTGIGVVDLQKLQIVAQRSGVDFEQLSKSLDLFARNVGRAQHGTGDLAKVMNDPKIGFKLGKTMMESLLNLADAVKSTKSVGEEFRITTAGMGRSSAQLVGMLQQGGESIQDQMNKWKHVITPEANEALAKFAVSWKEIEISSKNIAAGPLAKILDGLDVFLQNLEQGTWLQKLQTLAALFPGLIAVPLPAVTLEDQLIEAGHAVDVATAKVIKMQAQMDSLKAAGRSPFMAFSQEEFDKQVAAMTAAQTRLAALVKQRPPGEPEPPKDFGDKDELEQVLRTRMKTLADLKEAQAKLAEATGQAQAELLKGTSAYYAKVRENIKTSTAASIAAVEANKEAAIAGLSDTGRSAEAEANIVAKAEADKKTIRAKAADDIEKNNQEELKFAQQKADETRELQANLALATAEDNADRLSNTSAYFDALRRQENIATDTAVADVEARKKNAIAGLNEQALGHDAYVVEVERIEQDAATEIETIHTKTRANLRNIDQQQIQDVQQKSDTILQIEQTRAAALRDLAGAQVETRIIKSRLPGGGGDEFSAIRAGIEQQLQAQKDGIAEKERLDIKAAEDERDRRLKQNAEDLEAIQEFEEKAAGIHDTANANRETAEEQAHQKRIQTDATEQDARLSALSDFFGNLATLSQSSNATLRAIGKASAIAQATIDGIAAVQKALASPAGFPYNFALAAAVGVATALNVAKIAAQAKGGIVGPRGPMRLSRYARGGVASSPQMAMFGEGGTPEAFVPLPDGRRIPVSLRMPSIPAGMGGPTQLAQHFSIDARGAQRGVGEEIEARMRVFGPLIASSAVAVVNKRLPDMMRKATSRKL